MLSAEDRALRLTGITATDATAIAEVNPWSGPEDVYREKLGETKPTTRPMQRGHEAEPKLCELLAAAKGLTANDYALAPGHTERHRIHDWVLATPDRDVSLKGARVAVMEVKLVGPRQWSKWLDAEGQVHPAPYVYCQALWQMLARSVRTAFVGAALLTDEQLECFDAQGPNTLERAPFYAFELSQDDDIAGELLERCGAFWHEHIKPRVPLDGMLDAAPPDADTLARAYLDAHEQESVAKAAKKYAGDELRKLVGERPGIEAASWSAKYVHVNASIDWEQAARAAGVTEEQARAHLKAAKPRFEIRKKG